LDLELDERKKIILKAIIQTYLDTGDPVGSRTISKYTDLNLSSATIRNEMSDLEEMGYIIQPHTSAGRIPSDKGYRYYVNQLIRENEEKDQQITEVRDLMIKKTDRLESVLKQVVKALANNTNYATMIMPSVHSTRLKFIQLSRLHDQQLLAVIVAQGNMVKNRLIDLEEPIDDEQLLKLNLLLNTQLNGLSIGEINLEMIQKMKEQAGIHSAVISTVVDAVAEAIKPDRDDTQVYTSGAKNIFKYPELADSESASELISAFEDKGELAEMLQETGADAGDGDIQVYIGRESPLQNMDEVSVVTANYDLGDGMTGRIGIVGPRRMDYKNVVNNLKTMKIQLDTIFKGKGGDGNAGDPDEGTPEGRAAADPGEEAPKGGAAGKPDEGTPPGGPGTEPTE
jgi:heat-inducible transcriptional repressor